MTATLQQAKGSPFTRILSYGAARGDLVVPNSELIEAIDSSDEWIQQRTGIIERRACAQGPGCRRPRRDGVTRGDQARRASSPPRSAP